ncbi:MAG TPA: hypothetical protein VFU15_17120 [Bacteroidia bacterium]|nr:hypothetical protein [Bacteroidia bacterium]
MAKSRFDTSRKLATLVAKSRFDTSRKNRDTQRDYGVKNSLVATLNVTVETKEKAALPRRKVNEKKQKRHST